MFKVSPKAKGEYTVCVSAAGRVSAAWRYFFGQCTRLMFLLNEIKTLLTSSPFHGKVLKGKMSTPFARREFKGGLKSMEFLW